MCLQLTSVRSYQKWHWAGDEIVPDPIIPAMRRVPVKGGGRFDIDIREFLSVEGDAVIRREIEKLRAALPDEQKAAFVSRLAGSFDARKRAVVRHMRDIPYIKSERRFDAWLYPAETISRAGGDCEDRALLLAALLEASGISAYCIRVALGAVVDRTDPARPRSHAHAWVMYQSESGVWELIEPLTIVPDGRRSGARSSKRAPARRAAPRADIEYVPHFVLNRHHLWRVRSADSAAASSLPQYLEDRRFWEAFDPEFATGVHESIYDVALAGMSADDLDTVKTVSFNVDVNVLAYDPRDHFDFAYIDDGWRIVNERLQGKSIQEFALAVHAIADFYAHTVYGIRAPRDGAGNLPVYDPANPLAPALLQYDFSGFGKLPGCSSSNAVAAAYWSGKLISGQWWRWYSTFPADLKANAADLARRRCLPDHDSVAVDKNGGWSEGHMLTRDQYQSQFLLRTDAATRHIQAVYAAWAH